MNSANEMRVNHVQVRGANFDFEPKTPAGVAASTTLAVLIRECDNVRVSVSQERNAIVR